MKEILIVILYALAILTTVLLVTYLYCLYGRWQERRKYRKFDGKTKDRIMRTIVKR
jgi:hypothetical protein